MIGVKLNFQDISTNVRISNADHHLRQEFEASEKITRRGTRLAPVARGSLAFKQGETDMNTKQIVLDSYTAANEDQRLGLYMFHRELRDEFLEIEMKPEGVAKSPTVRISVRNRLGQIVRILQDMLSADTAQAPDPVSDRTA